MRISLLVLTASTSIAAFFYDRLLPTYGDASSEAQPTCPSCRIRFVPVAIIRDAADSVFLDERGTPARDGRGRFLLWTTERGRIARYDSVGKLQTVLGRAGDGPGEFNSNFGPIVPLPDGRVVVFEQGRVSILSADLNFQRRISLRVRVMGNPIALSNRILIIPGLASEASGSPSGVQHTLHALDLVNGVLQPIGAHADASPVAGCAACRTRHLTPSGQQGGFWAANSRSYRIDHWSSTGRSYRMLETQGSGWFPNDIGQAMEAGEQAANSTVPIIRALWRDSDNRLFVLGGASANGRIQRERPQHRQSLSPRAGATESKRVEIIDVLDARSGALVATWRQAGPPFFKSLGNGFLSSTEHDDDGAIIIRIVRAELVKGTR